MGNPQSGNVLGRGSAPFVTLKTLPGGEEFRIAE
jgi:hypothetical protein